MLNKQKKIRLKKKLHYLVVCFLIYFKGFKKKHSTTACGHSSCNSIILPAESSRVSKIWSQVSGLDRNTSYCKACQVQLICISKPKSHFYDFLKFSCVICGGKLVIIQYATLLYIHMLYLSPLCNSFICSCTGQNVTDFIHISISGLLLHTKAFSFLLTLYLTDPWFILCVGVFHFISFFISFLFISHHGNNISELSLSHNCNTFLSFHFN